MSGNFIFIDTNPISNMILSVGLTSADYVNGLNKLPENIILLNNDEESANGYNSHSKFNLLSGEGDIRRYLLKNPNASKKFIDYFNEDSLNNLTPYEIAELLYLAHMGTPMGRPFSSKLLNRYIYLSFPNEMNRTYYRRFSDFNHILDVGVKRKLREVHNALRVFLRPLVIKDIENSDLLDLVTRANDGLFISFEDIKERSRIYHIPLIILDNPDMASIVLKTDTVTESTKKVGDLQYNMRTSTWNIEWTK